MVVCGKLQFLPYLDPRMATAGCSDKNRANILVIIYSFMFIIPESSLDSQLA